MAPRKKKNQNGNENVMTVTAWQKKYKVLNMRQQWDKAGHAYLRIMIGNSNDRPVKVVINCRERDENTGNIIDNTSESAPRETSWIGPIYVADIRRKAMALGIAQLLFVNKNRLDEEVMSAMYKGWFTFKCTPYKAGDIIPGTDGKPYSHASQNIEILDGQCDDKQVEQAYKLITIHKAMQK